MYFPQIFLRIIIFFIKIYRSSRRRCSGKQMFLQISQNQQENTCARVSFLIKQEAYIFFTEHLRTTASQCKSDIAFRLDQNSMKLEKRLILKTYVHYLCHRFIICVKTEVYIFTKIKNTDRWKQKKNLFQLFSFRNSSFFIYVLFKEMLNVSSQHLAVSLFEGLFVQI